MRSGSVSVASRKSEILNEVPLTGRLVSAAGLPEKAEPGTCDRFSWPWQTLKVPAVLECASMLLTPKEGKLPNRLRGDARRATTSSRPKSTRKKLGLQELTAGTHGQIPCQECPVADDMENRLKADQRQGLFLWEGIAVQKWGFPFSVDRRPPFGLC